MLCCDVLRSHREWNAHRGVGTSDEFEPESGFGEGLYLNLVLELGVRVDIRVELVTKLGTCRVI